MARAFPGPGAGGAGREALGRLGERIAASHLRGLGYRVLKRNFRGPRGGEVDLVCRERGVLVFVEVKTRSGAGFGAPGEAVTPQKQRLVARGALAWLRMLGNPDVRARFDVVEVSFGSGADARGARCAVIRDAFPLPPPWVS